MSVSAAAAAILISTADGAAPSTMPEALPEIAAMPSAVPEAKDADRAFDPRSLLDLDFAVGPWSFHGYFQYDAALYDQAPEGPPGVDFRRGGVHESDPLSARKLADGSYLRRARVGFEGSFREYFAYRAVFELGANGQKGEPRIAEVWLSYNRFAPYVIQAGAFPQPSNMDGATSADSTLFLERATASDLARGLGSGDGRIGVTVKRTDKRWMAAVSLTGPVIDSAEDASPRGAIVGRVSRAVSWLPNYSIHVGLNGTYVLVPAKKQQQPLGRSGFPVRFQNTPEIDVDDTPLIDTGDILADHAGVVGVEFAAQRKNLYLQAEAFRFGVERHGVDTPGNPHFSGFYVQGSWILTGEVRRFDQSRGAFWFPKIDRPLNGGGWGAWELAFRYSRMDLNYRAGDEGAPPPPDGVRGGEQDIWAAALLWYPRPRVRLMLSYLHVSVDRLNPARPTDPEPFGPSPDTPPVGVQIGQDLNIVAIRARYSF